MQYVREDAGAIAAKELVRAGVKLHPGEQVSYIILDQKAKVKGDRARSALLLTGNESYDKERYVELIPRASGQLGARGVLACSYILHSPMSLFSVSSLFMQRLHIDR